MFSNVLLAFALGLALNGCSSGSKLDKKEEALLHLNLGSNMLADGLLPQAFRALSTAKRLDPENPVTYNNLGLAFSLRKKYAEAEESFKTALKILPNYTDAKNNFGRMKCDMGEYVACIKLLESANTDLTYPNPERILQNLGYAYFKNGQIQKARITLKDALEIRPTHCESFFYFSRTYYELEQFEQAAALFDRAIRICANKRMEEPRYYSGLSYLKMGKTHMATAKFEEVIHKAPLSEFANRSKTMLKLMAKVNEK